MKSIISFALIVLGIFLVFGQIDRNSYTHSEKNTETKTTVLDTVQVLSLDIVTPILFSQSGNEKEIQTLLKSGVVHLAGTALPGETGNVYIVGHSSDSPWIDGEYKTIFSKLPEIELNAEIKITYQGDEYIYTIKETKTVEADDLSVLEQPTDEKLLTLQTSYPIGTALKRFVVIAKLSLSE